jgi:nitrogen fixation-related uncharacterized protein
MANTAKVPASAPVAKVVTTPKKVVTTEDDTQTWHQFTDAEGKAHRVKSEDYVDGTFEVVEQTYIQFTDAKGKAHRVKSEDYKDGI